MDRMLPFLLEQSAIRGRLVRLGSTLDAMLANHDYPLPVATLLAEASAIAATFAFALKFDGILTIQTKTDGPLRQLVVDVTSDGALRGCASFDASKVKAGMSGTDLMGKGHLVLTVDQKASETRYQGIVKLEGETLAEALQTYFKQSEQVPTGLLVAARQNDLGHWHAGSLMVQRMPREGGIEAISPEDSSVEDDWRRVMILMQTCTPDELTNPDLSPEELLYRLFHQEGTRIHPSQALRHACRCSREKIEGVLRNLPESERGSLADENGKIVVTCEFCNQIYLF